MDKENKINIMHLSDLHFGDESKTDAAKRKNVLDELLETLRGLDSQWKPHLVVISGDIGWKGVREDYEQAKAWLCQLLNLLNLKSEDLIVCPGNHDVDLEKAKVLVIPTDSKSADEYLKIEELEPFTGPFKSYISFCKEMEIPPLTLGDETSFLVGTRIIKDIRFIVLNSAWFYRENNDRDLWIGLPQLKLMKANGQLDGEQMLTIAVLHHPPEWLHEEEITSQGNRINTYEYLSEYCALIFSGHVHGVLKNYDQKFGHAFLFTGGSSYSDDTVRNNFSIFQVNLEKGNLIRRPYEFDPANGKWRYNENYEVESLKIKSGSAPESSPTDVFHSALFNGSKAYYQDLNGINGRFKHLEISGIILPKPEKLWLETKVYIDDKDTETLDILIAIQELRKKDCKHALILGDGGMGKTVSLIRIWEEYTKNSNEIKPVPVFIALNEYNQLLQASDRKNFIVSMIKKNYLGSSFSENDIREIMKTPIKGEDDFVPSMILLLDGFNEITVDKRELLIELIHIIEQARGIQIIVSSRYDMRGVYNWNHFSLLRLLELSDDQVISYIKEQVKVIPHQVVQGGGSRLVQLIRNPMMLTLYTATCEIQKNHQDNKYCSFKERVETPGELLWNFLEAQAAQLFERVGLDEGKQWFYKFLLKVFLPAMGYEMEKAGRFEFSREELSDFIETYCVRFCRDDFFLAFPGYERYENDLDVGECENSKEMRGRRSKIIEILSEKLCMMVEEGDSFRFLHQNFRDFFAANHILNEVAIGLKKNEVAGVLKDRTISFYVRRYLGEISGEHYGKPFFVDGKGWEINENKKSMLYMTLDLCRGVFDNSIGFSGMEYH